MNARIFFKKVRPQGHCPAGHFFKFKVKAVSISKALNLRKQHISLKRTFDINYFTSEVTTYLLNKYVFRFKITKPPHGTGSIDCA